jgi:hypothetical protein
LVAAINIFVPAAEKLGVMIDSTAQAECYVLDSIARIEPLLGLPLSQFESGVEQMTETWATRPQQLAESLFTERKVQCAS